jgi:regulator of PEP synthase PpsR (kinase-PPPase family)
VTSGPRTIVLHLVSHASGELVEMLARNAVAQLEGVHIERTLWKMVRSLAQIPEILATVAERGGFVVHSVADPEIRGALEAGCYQMRAPCVFALEPLVSALAEHFAAPVQFRASAREAMDDEYFRRVEAMKYTLAHDDGLAADDLEDADVVLVGVSRATKTPTCMYLASRGIKAANVPLVPGVPLPDGVMQATQPLIVGLTINPSRLSLVRQSRLSRLKEEHATDYAEMDSVTQEVTAARRLFVRQGWPVIDVTHRSIEQAAAMILDLMAKRTT